MIKIPRLAVAFVEIKGITGKFKASMAQAQRITNKFGSSATKSIRRVTLGLVAMGVAAAAAAVAIGVKLAQALIRAGRATIQTAVKYDKLVRGLTAVSGSSKEARRQLVRLRDVAKLPGLSFAEAIQGSTALQAAGLSANLAERSLKAFGNALVTVGKGARDLKGVNLALTQIVTKQTGFGQELRQLSERLPQVRKAMKDAFGIGSVEDFQKLGLAAEDFIEGIVIEFEKLPKVTGTVANALENLGISFDLLKNSIGKKLLEATEIASTSLTDIIDGLTLVIQNYEKYRDEAAKVFRQVGLIGIELTGQMILGMSKIVAKFAKIAWIPLKFEILKVMRDVNDEVEIGIINVMGTIREFFGGDAEIARLQRATVKTTRIAWNSWFKQMRDVEFTTGIREGIDGIAKDFNTMFTQFMAGMAGMKRATDEFGANIPKAIAPAETAIEKMQRLLAKLRETRGRGRGLLLLPPEDPAKAEARLRDSQSRIIKSRDDIDKDMADRQKRQLANFREFLDEARERAEEVARALSPAFENLFGDLFSGNTKNLWQNFFSDLKRIALRELAAVFAFQLVSGLLTGGGSFGAGGLLSALAPTSIDPTSRAIGGGIARGASAVGSFLEGGQGNTFVFNQTDFANMDPVRLAKTASQQIAPALAEEAIDGR